LGYKWDNGLGHNPNRTDRVRDVVLSAQFLEGDQNRESILIGVMKGEKISNLNIKFIGVVSIDFGCLFY
jgi:hypothetical protein